MGLASAAMIAGWLTITAATGGATQAPGTHTEAELARMAAQVQAMKADVPAHRSTESTAQRIEARQQFLDALLSGRASGAELAELLPPKGNRSAGNAAVSGILAPFAALERKQTALMTKAAATAEARVRNAESLLDRLGISAAAFPGKPAAESKTASAADSRKAPGADSKKAAGADMGGPFVPSPASADDADPQYAAIYENLQRAEEMERSLSSLPSFVPVREYRLSSGFGSRKDPFNGRRARHTGLDLAGNRGQPVYAAASGKVIRAGRFSGYGNCVDIDHGNGVVTRYGHLSTIGVKVGQKVAVGERIAAMGSTGRSTGNHLHYEVRIDGQPVNPLPFIEASTYILAFKEEVAGPDLAASF